MTRNELIRRKKHNNQPTKEATPFLPKLGDILRLAPVTT